MTYLSSHLAQIGALTLQHAALVLSGLAIALVLAAPLSVLALRVSRVQTTIFGVTGVIYTIPSLALLAVAVKYLGLGFWPVVLVLAAYAQFILVRAITTALRGVPSSQIDAARGLGLTPLQQLVRVELPLAAPVLIGGLRLATIALIAIATLGGYVGAGGLGNDIFLGLQNQYVAQTLAGSIPIAALAIAADGLLRGLERVAVRRITG